MWNYAQRYKSKAWRFIRRLRSHCTCSMSQSITSKINHSASEARWEDFCSRKFHEASQEEDGRGTHWMAHFQGNAQHMILYWEKGIKLFQSIYVSTWWCPDCICEFWFKGWAPKLDLESCVKVSVNTVLNRLQKRMPCERDLRQALLAQKGKEGEHLLPALGMSTPRIW